METLKVNFGKLIPLLLIIDALKYKKVGNKCFFYLLQETKYNIQSAILK